MLLAYELYVVNGLDSAIADGPGLQAARGSYRNRGRLFELILAGFDCDRPDERVELYGGKVVLHLRRELQIKLATATDDEPASRILLLNADYHDEIDGHLFNPG